MTLKLKDNSFDMQQLFMTMLKQYLKEKTSPTVSDLEQISKNAMKAVIALQVDINVKKLDQKIIDEISKLTLEIDELTLDKITELLVDEKYKQEYVTMIQNLEEKQKADMSSSINQQSSQNTTAAANTTSQGVTQQVENSTQGFVKKNVNEVIKNIWKIKQEAAALMQQAKTAKSAQTTKKPSDLQRQSHIKNPTNKKK